MCKCDGDLHELECDDYVIQSDIQEVNASFIRDKERAEQRHQETTSFYRRRVLAQANGHAKDYNLIPQ